MKVRFTKYHGTGNDFILVDNRRSGINLTGNQIKFLCNRHFGIGADGLIFLNDKEGYDFSMTYFNSDGRESSMCGNGARCLTAFARRLDIIQDRARFLAMDGEHFSEIISVTGDMMIRVKMKDTKIITDSEEGIFINTGSPHFVTFIENMNLIDVVARGRAIRYDESFAPEGTNVDFAEISGQGLFVRTYERGVEDETLSCGTGVTAAAIAAAYISGENPGKTIVRTMGGDLRVYFRQEGHLFTEVWLEGSATYVYTGELEIPAARK
ncbi:MAG: diaminopimelate epimerase [bacterium]